MPSTSLINMKTRTYKIYTLALLTPCALATAQTATSSTDQASSLKPAYTTLPAISVHSSARNEINGPINFNAVSSTASRLGLTIAETPATVTVIDRTTIEQRGAQDTQEMLRGVPGVTASAPPGAISVSYRGFTSGQVAVLYNGLNVQETSQATRPVDSWIYDRVEAMGGPAGFLYGAGAVGGALNYVSKTAQREEAYEAQASIGSYGLRSLGLGMNRQLTGHDGSPAHYLRIDLHHRGSDGWVDRNGSRANQVALSLLSDLTPKLSHTLAYEFQHEKERSPYFGTPVLNPMEGELQVDPGTLHKNYNSKDAQYTQHVQWLRSVLDYRATDTWQFRNTAYMYDTRRDFRNVENYNYTTDNTAIIRSGPYLQRHEHRLYGNRIEALHQGYLGSLKSDWAFGIDASVGHRTNSPSSVSYSSIVDPYDFDVEDFFDIPGMKDEFRKDRRTKLRTLSLSAENRTALLDNLHLVTALRHERLKLDLHNYRTPTPTNPKHFSRSYSATTGRIGLVWDPLPGVNLYAQYATAADAPAGSLSSTSYANLNANSELSTGKQFEIGGRFDFWNDRATLGLSAYKIERKNVATPDPQDPRSTIQAGQQSSRGVELYAGVRPTSSLHMQANLAYVDARYDEFSQNIGGIAISRAGNVPTNVPKVVANLWVDYDFHPQWTASAGVRHVGKVYGNVANTYNVPAYTLLDLGLAYRASPSVTLTGRVRNVTDKQYAVGTNSISYYYAGAPRTYELTVRAAF
ncbi:TonB-dependent siderophore receptor [Alcaligenes faecalis]|nr:TonB-dependent siderophore receptor [Alcaligenes faecalis]